MENNVYASLANGQIAVFNRESNGAWLTNEPKLHQICSTSILKLLPVAGKIWCPVQNQIKVLSTVNLTHESSFYINFDTDKSVLCMVSCGLGVWISTQSSPVLKLFHGTSYECLIEINVASAVSKMLTTACDEIIRQHKSACLRVTALLSCKDLLWIGTSAGTVLTLSSPHINQSTTCLDYSPNISGIAHGHTGHVRFLTNVEITGNTSSSVNHTSAVKSDTESLSHCQLNQKSSSTLSSNSTPSNMSNPSTGPPVSVSLPTLQSPLSTNLTSIVGGTSGAINQVTSSSTVSSPSSTCSKRNNAYNCGKNQASTVRLLVISGGDGHEDFTTFGHSDAVGRDDSTNHLLLWQV